MRIMLLAVRSVLCDEGYGLLLAAVAALACTDAALGQPAITSVGVVPDRDYSIATGVSADGSVVVGYSDTISQGNYIAFRWTAADGIQSLGAGSYGCGSDASGVSRDGSVVVGTIGTCGGAVPFIWTATFGMQSLGSLGVETVATGVSGDGLAVVGYGNGGWRWTAVGGYQGVGEVVPPSTYTTPWGVNGDGSVVVGSFSTPVIYNHAMRWTEAGGIQDLGAFAGVRWSTAYGASGDSSVIVGQSGPGSLSLGPIHAFRWTAALGMQDIDMIDALVGPYTSYAYSASGDGSVIVGIYYGSQSTSPFYWAQSLGMVDLSTYLTTLGVDLTGWSLQVATGVSADGSAIVGYGQLNGEYRGWVVNGLPQPPPCNTDLVSITQQPVAAALCLSGPASFSVAATGGGAIAYHWQVEDLPVGSGLWADLTHDGQYQGYEQEGGPQGGLCADIEGARAPTLSVGRSSYCDATGRPQSQRFRCIVSNACGSIASNEATLTVCYANCDCSTTAPVLNVADFTCFLQKYAGQDPYANCDNSTTEPMLNVADFTCFLQKYAAGCS